MKLSQLLTFSLLYLIVLIACLSTCAGIIIIQVKFNEGCGLHFEIFSNSNFPKISYTTTTEASACLYVIYMPIAVAHITLYLFVYHMWPAIIMMSGNKPSYEIWTKSCLTITILLAVSVFFGCVDITKGFHQTCRQLEAIQELEHKSCEENFSLVVWRRKKEVGIYEMLLLAEVSCWIAFSVLAVIITLWSYLIFYNKRSHIMLFKQYSINSTSTVETSLTIL